MTRPRWGSDAPEDRILRARQGDLPAGDRAELDRTLDGDPALRLLFQIGRDFDALDEPHAGDEALVSCAARGALANRSSRGSGRRRIPAVVGVVAAVVASGVVAWAAFVRPTKDRAATAPVVVAPRPPSPADPVAPSATVGAVPAEATEPAPARDGDPATRTSGIPKRPPPASDTAAEIFRQAAGARRSGDVDGACSLYLDLQRRFPRSKEAEISQISVGKLLLQRGRASDADRHFAAYLASGAGDLAEEALVGRAESAQQLARREDERRAWERLLREHPRSIYAAQAKRRIEEIDGAAP